MAGLDKIIEKIQADSDKKCQEIISQAKQATVDILNDAERDGKNEYTKIMEQAQKQTKNDVLLKKSGIQMNSSRTILSAKNEAIGYALDATLKTLKTMDDKLYFAFIARLIIKNAQKGNGVLYFSENDLKRVPNDFIAAVSNQLGAEKKIELSKKAAAIEDGFLLIYGDIEVNCTFKALLHSNSEDIKEIICKIIF